MRRPWDIAKPLLLVADDPLHQCVNPAVGVVNTFSEVAHGIPSVGERPEWEVLNRDVVNLAPGDRGRDTVEFTSDRVMVTDVTTPAPADGVIDLLGPPW